MLALARAEIGSTVVRKESASDIVQESLLDAMTGFAQFNGATNHELRAWLHRIVRNRSVDVARRYRQSEMRDISRELPLNEALLEGVALDDASPSERAGQHETTQRMLAAISRLSEPYQSIVRMRYGEGKSFASIASMLNRSPFDARRTWYAALRLLRQELKEDV
jgi:RNA polymerase sigma-70 factor (ECF subfamily)